MNSFVIIILTIFILNRNVLFCEEQSWTYELLDIKTFSDNHDIVEYEFTRHRIARGQYGVDGYVNLKEDIDDRYSVTAALYKSSLSIDGPWVKTPMQVPKSQLTDCMNSYYKDYIMEPSKHCTDNAPIYETFEAPLTKRSVKVNNCVMSTDKLPKKMAKGFYRLDVNLEGPANTHTEFLFEILDK